MNYTQQIYAIDIVPQVDTLKNVAISVKWELILREGVRAAGSYHVTELNPVVNPDKFVEYSDLTHEQVLNWVNDKENLQQHLDNLQSQLDQQNTSVVFETQPPWNTNSQNWLKNRYVLVHDDEIIWGPDKWNPEKINAALFDHDIPASVSRDRFSVLMENHAQIHDHTHMYMVKEGVANQPEVDYLFESVTENTWSFSEEHGAQQVAGTVIQRPLEDIKQDLIGMLQPEPVFDMYNMQFPLKVSDTQTVNVGVHQLLLCLCAQNLEGSIAIVDMQGQTHTLDQNQIAQAIQHVAVGAQPVDHSDQIAAINAAQTVEQLREIHEGMV
jgi:hypothetical protein